MRHCVRFRSFGSLNDAVAHVAVRRLFRGLVIGISSVGPALCGRTTEARQLRTGSGAFRLRGYGVCVWRWIPHGRSMPLMSPEWQPLWPARAISVWI